MWLALLQPVSFFRRLATVQDTRQWFWMALIILALTGLSAVRANNAISSTSESPGIAPVDTGGPIPGDPFGGPVLFEGGGPGGPPDAGGSPTGTSDVSANWETALIAASNVVLAWLLLVALLCEVSLTRGQRPRLSANIQIAIWASVPLGLMAALQLVYFYAGGTAGEPGLAGLLPEWDWYAARARGEQSLIYSGALRMTLFALWTLALVYLGARHTLRGRWWASLVVMAAWVALIITLPMLAGTVKAPEPAIIAADQIPPVESAPPDGVIEPMLEGETLEYSAEGNTP